MQILITGASGFIGNTLSRDLIDQGWSVRGLVRSDDAIVAHGVERVRAQMLEDARQLAPAVNGADVVVHLAGLAHVGGRAARDAHAFERANVHTTRVLLEAARAAGARLFVHLSSMAVFGNGAAAPIDEDAIPHPTTAYGRSKLEAEHAVRAARDAGFATVILRPPMVYGPGMKGNPLRLFRWIDRGRPVPFASLHNRRSILYSGNLSAAVVSIMKTSDVPSPLFHVADPEPVTMAELVRWIAAALGRKPRLIALPAAVLERAARLLRVVPGPARLASVSAELHRAMQDFVVDTRRINRMLGFRPPWDSQEGIDLTASWFLQAEGSATRRTAS